MLSYQKKLIVASDLYLFDKMSGNDINSEESDEDFFDIRSRVGSMRKVDRGKSPAAHRAGSA